MVGRGRCPRMFTMFLICWPSFNRIFIILLSTFLLRLWFLTPPGSLSVGFPPPGPPPSFLVNSYPASGVVPATSAQTGNKSLWEPLSFHWRTRAALRVCFRWGRVSLVNEFPPRDLPSFVTCPYAHCSGTQDEGPTHIAHVACAEGSVQASNHSK